MNLPALAPQWLLGIFLGLLALAAIEDAIRLRISNLVSAAVLLTAVLAVVLSGPSVVLWQNLLLFVAVLVLGTLLFSAGKLGGGDVKLLAASSLWFNFSGGLRLVAAVTIVGGLLTIVVLLVRKLRGLQGSTPASSGVPYGIAIAAGAATAALILQTPARTINPLEAPIPGVRAR